MWKGQGVGRVRVDGRQITHLICVRLKSADRRRGQRKGATSKNVNDRQKVSKLFSTLFDIFRAGQKKSKIVKKCQKYFRHFSTIFARHQFSGPFWGAPIKHLLYDFWWGVLGLLPVVFRIEKARNTTPKKSYSKCLRRTKIR